MKDNREFIFYRQFNNAGATGGEDLIDLVKHSYPHNSGWDGWNTNAVSLKQVDAYYMFDGRDKDNASEAILIMKTVLLLQTMQIVFISLLIALLRKNIR